MVLAILDKSVAALKEALPTFSLGELELLRDAEDKGKTRASALAAIDEAIAAADPAEQPADEPEPVEPDDDDGPDERVSFDGEHVVTNILPGTTLHLGDGRRLAFGESAGVSEELAVFLRERGQVE